jgi:signal transduction histidine kinase
MTRLLRSYSFRLTLLYVGLFGVSVMVIFAVVYGATAGYMVGGLELSVEAEMSALLDARTAGGLPGLIAAVNEHASGPNHRSTFTLLQDASGKRLAGNLPAQPVRLGWQDLPLPSAADEGADEEDTVHAKGLTLNGLYLLVGESTFQLKETREFMVRSIGWGLLVMAALALIGGMVMSASLLRRVEAVRRTAQEIMAGDLSRRVPTRGTGDDFDQLSASLNEMLDRIQTLMEGLRQVTNDIAHDLRTPLTRLRQRLEAARLKARTVEDYTSILDSTLGDTDQILRTFGAMLRIAQIEAGTARSRFTDVDLSEVLRAIVDLYAAFAEDQKQELSGQIADGVRVHGDRELLTQMLVNPVENALRHCPAGTRIAVRLERLEGAILCTIADNGPGIPRHEHDKVFRRFYRLDSSRATPGNGLGLSLVAAIAELHGIAVTLGDNQPGLVVSLRFPPVTPQSEAGGSQGREQRTATSG